MLMRKFVKPALLALALVGAASAATTAAKADVNVEVGIGGYDRGWDDYDSREYFRPTFRHHQRFRISCWEGKDRVEWAGFRRVRPVDCSGSRYTYKARKHGDVFVISVNSRTGRIVSVRGIY